MTKASPINLPYFARLFWFAVAILVLLSASYLVLVSQSIFNVAEREDLNRVIAQRASEVAKLEAIYLAKTQAVTLERAHELGYVSGPPKTFASRIDLSPTLSLRSSEE